LQQDPGHVGIGQCLADLNRLYLREFALHGSDWDPQGFGWLELHNAQESVFAIRRGRLGDGHAPLVCVFNATPVPRIDYRVGVEVPGAYECIFNSDAGVYGGSDHAMSPRLGTEGPLHAFAASLRLTLPPLGAVFYRLTGS